MTWKPDHYLSIHSWAEEDRPREKLLLKGKSALSDAELIAILIGSGTRRLSAVELSRQILAHVNYNLNELAKLEVKPLMEFKGIGQAKAITIVSALELGRRRKAEATVRKIKITSSHDAYQYMERHLMDLPHEEFWILLLSQSNSPIKEVCISKGGLTGTVADTRVIFKYAIENNACSMILFHNHPSGNLKPSSQDIQLTRKMKNAGEILDIKVLDHLIFTNDGYFSFSDESMMS